MPRADRSVVPPHRRVQRLRGHAGVRARAAFLLDHPVCKQCHTRGIVEIATEVDHIVPLHKGGSDHDSNKQALCTPCHVRKTADDKGYTPNGCDARGTPVAGWSA